MQINTPHKKKKKQKKKSGKIRNIERAIRKIKNRLISNGRILLPLSKKIKKRRMFFFFQRIMTKKLRKKEFLRKKFLIYKDLGLITDQRPPIKICSILDLEHLFNTPRFISDVIKFLLIYPFSAPEIGSLFNVKLKSRYFVVNNINNFINFLNLLANKRVQLNAIAVNLLLKTINLKNLILKLKRDHILEERNKKFFGKQKHKMKFGLKYNFIRKKRLLLRHRKIKTKFINRSSYFLANMNKYNKNNINNIKEIDKIVSKSLFAINEISYKKMLEQRQREEEYFILYGGLYHYPLFKRDFFYYKHLKQIRNYVFK